MSALPWSVRGSAFAMYSRSSGFCYTGWSFTGWSFNNTGVISSTHANEKEKVETFTGAYLSRGMCFQYVRLGLNPVHTSAFNATDICGIWYVCCE